MKLIICGCAKNIVNFWTNTSKNLQIIFDSLEDYKCIIIESNSTDNSLEVLNDWSKNNPKINIVSLGNLQEQSRTKRIALCRNKYLENIEPFYEEFPYCLFLDLDNALEIYDNFKEQLQSCFQFNNSSHDTPTENSIKVMSYNVRLFDLYNWSNNFC